VTAAVVAVVSVVGQVGGGRARPVIPAAGKTSGAAPCGGRLQGQSARLSALLKQMAVLRHPTPGTGHQSFIPPSWHALRNDVRYDRALAPVHRLYVAVSPVLLCVLPDGLIDPGNPRSVAQEHVLVEVLGPKIGEHEWVDGGNARQIAAGDAFSGFHLRNHHWLQVVLTANDVARVSFRLHPAGGPTFSRSLTPVNNVVAAVVGVNDGPSIITSYDVHGRVLHRETTPSHDCQTLHTARACAAAPN
jgi:hypothetical protein